MCLQSAKALDSRHRNYYIQLLWTFFAPVAPPLLMLWLWARINSYFEHHHIPFPDCFPEHERKWLAPARDLYNVCRAYSCIALASLAACAALCTKQDTILALMVPPVFYCSMLILLVMPVNVLRKGSRLFLVQTLFRVLVPLQTVSWADFLLADMLTSLAKSSSDISRSTCLMLHGEPSSCRFPVLQEVQ
jgi:hypothetical protein